MADFRRFTTTDFNGRNIPRCQGCQERDARIAQLQERLKSLTRELQQLRERAGRNASNSSTPPSENPLDAPKVKTGKEPSGRKRGGQPGHPPQCPEFALLSPNPDLEEASEGH